MESLKRVLKEIPKKAIGLVSVVSLASALLVPKTAEAEGSVEVTVGNDKINFETEVYGSNEDLDTYLWSIVTMDDGEIGLFSNISFMESLDDVEEGLDFLMTVQAYSEDFPIVLRAGLGYTTELSDDLDFYKSVSLGIRLSNPDVELITGLLYHPILFEESTARIKVESINYIGLEGHEYSTQRLRVGAGDDAGNIGLFLDVEEVGDDFDLDFNIGPYFMVNFE